jgi:hypothetical protein
MIFYCLRPCPLGNLRLKVAGSIALFYFHAGATVLRIQRSPGTHYTRDLKFEVDFF